jgi:PKD repeat protein
MVTTGQRTQKETNSNDNNIIDKNLDEQKIGKFTVSERLAMLSPLPEKTPEQLEKMIKNPQPLFAADDLPSSFSWKSFGGDWSTPARDQQNCGSCWDFAALGAIEPAINIAKGDPDFDPDLSEQYVLSCLSAAGSCSGGWMSEAIDYIQSTAPGSSGNSINGVPLETCFPYQAVDWIPCDDKCPDWDTYSEPPEEDDILFQVEDFGVTSGNYNDPAYWDLMKSWIYTYGPISTDIYASSGWSSFWSSHHSPSDVYEGTETTTWTNHGNTIFGWVDDASVHNGGYWIVKNTWGPSFGYGGFHNLAYGCLMLGDRDLCWVTTPAWPNSQPPNPDIPIKHVYAGWDYDPAYPRLGDEIEFIDESEGPVVMWEWDFDGDGIIDSTDDDPTWTYTTEGLHEVYLKVWASSGLNSELTKNVEVKEIWPPIADCRPDYYGGDENEIWFDARYSYDVDGAIVAYAWDFDGDGVTDSTEDHIQYTFPDQNGEHLVTLTVTDNEGATTTQEIEVKIDKTVAPVTTATIGGIDQNEDQWFNKATTVELYSTDWTALIDLYYRINGGEWQNRYCGNEREFSYKFSIADRGINTIEYYAVDTFGNTETTKTAQVKIDKTNPSITYNLEGEKDGDVFITPVTVTLIPNDEQSGISITKYKEGYTGWQDYTGPFTVSGGGGYTITALTEDLAGNPAETTFEFVLEQGPYTPSISGPSNGAPGSSLTYTFTTTDLHGDDISFYIDWGDGTTTGWTDYVSSGSEITEDHVFSEQRPYTIKAKAKDIKGAESPWAEFTVTMPRSFNRFIFIQYILEQLPLLQKIIQNFFFI